jgi:hypothetical protein
VAVSTVATPAPHQQSARSPQASVAFNGPLPTHRAHHRSTRGVAATAGVVTTAHAPPTHAPVLPAKSPLAPAAPMPMPMPGPEAPPAPTSPSSAGRLIEGGARASYGQQHAATYTGLPLVTLVADQGPPAPDPSMRQDTRAAGWVVGGVDDPVLRPD